MLNAQCLFKIIFLPLDLISFRFLSSFSKFPSPFSFRLLCIWWSVCIRSALRTRFFFPFESWGWILNKYFVQFAYCVCRSFLIMKTHQRLRCISHRKNIIFLLKVWTEFWSIFFCLHVRVFWISHLRLFWFFLWILEIIIGSNWWVGCGNCSRIWFSR